MVLIPLLMCLLMLPRLFLLLLAFPENIHSSTVFIDEIEDSRDTANKIIWVTEFPEYSSSSLNAVRSSWVVQYGLPGVSILLFTCSLYYILCYLPGLKNIQHTQLDYQLKVLLPLVGSVLCYIAYDSLYYLGFEHAEANPVTDGVWFWIPCVLSFLAYILSPGSTILNRLRSLIGPFFLAIMAMTTGTGLAAWYATNRLLWSPYLSLDLSWAAYVTLAPPFVMLGFVLSSVLFVGLSSNVLKDEDREWISRALAGVGVVIFGWVLICFLVLILPNWMMNWHGWGQFSLGGMAIVSAWISSLNQTLTSDKKDSESGTTKVASMIWKIAIKAAPFVFLALLLGALSILTNLALIQIHKIFDLDLVSPIGKVVDWKDHYSIVEYSNLALVPGLSLFIFIITLVMSMYVNVNTFSLHAMYRDRLVRAYLGASNPNRNANGFTGFSKSDDIPMGDLDPGARPFHVLNLTLNLAASTRLDRQQRKADGFVVTPLHAGNVDLGFRPSRQYANGMTLGCALALSGAAASPNMGAYTSPLIGIIMTLFNTRLGMWLGSPGSEGTDMWRLPGPRFAIGLMIKEALGHTTGSSNYVYLSDGGHFENLGLYEMVRRRCLNIIVIDSGCDPNFIFSDLGNALRKIRIDLRIPIEFDEKQMLAFKSRQRRSVVGQICYSYLDGDVSDGRILYIKPMLRGNEMPDITSYAASNGSFPHQSTADQWFNESQTESYRVLGLDTIDEISRGWRGGRISEFIEHVETAPTE